MGQSTNAILFYGYCWHEELELWEGSDGGEDEWAERVTKRRGATDPWKDYPNAEMTLLPYEDQRRAGDAWVAANRAALDKWREDVEKVREEFGVDIAWHCSCDCPMPYVFVVGTETTARRGYPQRIDPGSLRLEGDSNAQRWDVMLDKFLTELEITKPSLAGGKEQKPGWWLVSHWC
jgi:hypothetical protein